MEFDADAVAQTLNPQSYPGHPSGFESIIGFLLDRNWGQLDILKLFKVDGLLVARETNDPKLVAIGPVPLIATAIGQYALSEGLDERLADQLIERLHEKTTRFQLQ